MTAPAEALPPDQTAPGPPGEQSPQTPLHRALGLTDDEFEAVEQDPRAEHPTTSNWRSTR